MSIAAQKAAEQVARQSYGRLLAFIAGYARDITKAEDALSGAFAKALETWPHKGVPDNPEGWLIQVARRIIGHGRRHDIVKDQAQPTLALLERVSETMEQKTFKDERLKLMFVCAHPAIAPNIRTPLMLQSVLGLNAKHIARCFLLPPTTMGQQLVRAKAKIADSGIAFQVPEKENLPARLPQVLDAIYAAFGTGWDDRSNDLVDEALYLGKLLVELLPNEAEAHGLLSLMAYSNSRANARRGKDGAYVALDEQDTELWDEEQILLGESHLHKAATLANPGRYQTEAAIQSVHASRYKTGVTNHAAIAGLYDVLWHMAPSFGAGVGRAIAHLNNGDANSALDILDGLSFGDVENYQPFWAARAAILAEQQNTEEAISAYDRAIELAGDHAVKVYLTNKRQALIIKH